MKIKAAHILASLLASALALPGGVALAQEGDGTRKDERMERRQAIGAEAAEEYEGDGTRVDDRVERRSEAADEFEGDGTRVDDRVERRQDRRDVLAPDD